MGTQKENVEINLKIHGIEEFKSYKGLSSQLIAQRNSVNKMDKADAGYAAAAAKLREMVALHGEWKQQIYGTNEATNSLKDAWNDIKKTISGVTIGNLLSEGIQGAVNMVRQFVGGSEEAYKEAEQNQAQLDAALKSTGGVASQTKDHLNEMAGELMNLTGIDDDLITKSESLLLTFTNIRGEIYDAALPAILDLSKALGSDLESATIQVGKALNNPVQGLTALRKVGISFSESQIALIKKMQETGDIASAQKMILAELSKEFGGVAEAVSNTESGSLERYQTRLGNIQEAIGGAITRTKAHAAALSGPFLSALESVTAALFGVESAGDLLSKEFDTQAKEVNNLQSSINPLLDRYDALKTKGSLNKTEQQELKTVIKQVADVIPGAVTQFNNLGEAMDINSGKARNFIDTQIAMLKIQNKEVIEQLKKDTEAYKKQRANLLKDLNAGNITESASIGVGAASTIVRKMTDDEIRKWQAMLADVGGKIKLNEDAIAGYSGDYLKYIADKNKPGPVTDIPFTPKMDKKGQSEAEKARLDAISKDKDLTKAYKEIGIERLNNLLSQNEKEVELVKQKFQKLIDEETVFLNLQGATEDQKKARSTQIADLLTQRDKAVADTRVKIEEEMGTAITNLRASLSKELETELGKEKVQINKFYDDQIAKNVGNADIIAKINANRAEDLTNAELREKQRLVDEKKRIEVVADADLVDTHTGRLAKIKQQYDAEIEALKEKFSAEGKLTQEFQDLLDKINGNRKTAIQNEEQSEKKEKERKKWEDVGLAVDGAQVINNAISSISANNRRAESDRKLRALDDQREKELSNANLTEEQKKAINDKFDAKVRAEKLRAWRADQNAAAKQAFIGGLLGAAKAMPNLILAAIALGTGIANAAVIKSQKPPEFKKGVLLNSKGGIPDGPSHSEGGINLINNRTGETIGEMEGGEPIMILSKETSRNNANLINELLFNSQFRNGAKVSVNTEIASQAIRPYRSGGFIQEDSVGPSTSPSMPVMISTKAMEDKMEEKFDQLIEVWQQGLPFNYRNDVEYRDKIATIEARVNG